MPDFSCGKISFGTRLAFRPMTGSVGDGLLVSYWRNSPDARSAFFSGAVVTPESHAAWLAAKSPWKQVWMVEDGDCPVGTAALYIDPETVTAETGPLLVAPECRGLGYAREIDYLMLATAFELFELRSLWGDAFAGNTAVLKLHQSVGFEMGGVDVEGHTHPRGPVQHILYSRTTWAGRRQDFVALGARLGAWTP
jgi:RimJ/RimL family protein N-acetyltransferase